jgi:hypothetical protein
MSLCYRKQRSCFSVIIGPLMFMMVVAGIFGMVRLGTGIVNVEYKIGDLEYMRTIALKERKAMKAEMSSMLSLRNVQGKGLELEFPDRQKVVFVKRDLPVIQHTVVLKEGAIPEQYE